jgi:antitoxin ParD1/3/4
MNLTLDPVTEQRIQREVELGHYRDPAEVIARAVSLLEAETEWLQRNKEALDQRLKESVAQIERGEGIPGDKLLEYLAEKRQSR